jgi:hypothetical protein
VVVRANLARVQNLIRGKEDGFYEIEPNFRSLKRGRSGVGAPEFARRAGVTVALRVEFEIDSGECASVRFDLSKTGMCALNVGLQAAARAPFAVLVCQDGGADREDERTLLAEPPDHQHSKTGSFAWET